MLFPMTPRFACYKEKYGGLSLPVSARAADTVLTLPMYADMTVADADRICDVILR